MTLFCRNFIQNQEECEDQVQEIFLKLYRKMDSYNPLFSWSTWIYRIARNHCIDYRRQASRQLDLTTAEINLNEGADPKRLLQPEQSLLRQEEEELVQKYLLTLSIDDRQIAMLKFSESMSSVQIGKVMELPSGTVRWRISKIRKGLIVWMEDE